MGLSLEIDRLAWSFEHDRAPFLKIDALRIPSGKTVALTGPSGSGKTSLLFLLAGMETPTYGRIAWEGFDIAAAGESARDSWRRTAVGLMFQDFRLIEDLSVIDNILLPASFTRWRPGAELRARAAELLDRMRLSKPDQSVATLSRGEMQRVALARALLFRPAILLADEPTASLDAENERIVWDLLLGAAHEQGATLVVATHHRGVLDTVDTVVALDHGRLVST